MKRMNEQPPLGDHGSPKGKTVKVDESTMSQPDCQPDSTNIQPLIKPTVSY